MSIIVLLKLAVLQQAVMIEQPLCLFPESLITRTSDSLLHTAHCIISYNIIKYETYLRTEVKSHHNIFSLDIKNCQNTIECYIVQRQIFFNHETILIEGCKTINY